MFVGEEKLQDETWFEVFKKTSVEKIYKRGDVFQVQEEAIEKVGLILSGKARATAYSVNGHETWVGEFSEGQFIGLINLLIENTSCFEITAITKLVVRTISPNNMVDLMRQDVSLCEAVAKDMSVRLNGTIKDMINVHTLSVKGRICSEILHMALPIGMDPDRHIIRPSPVFVELARRLNSTRETVSRTVSELQNQGILAREPGALIIENPERLRKAVQLI